MKSKRLFYRIMSMLLACVMALGSTCLVTTAASAAGETLTLRQQKLAVLDDLYFSPTGIGGDTHIYDFDVTWSTTPSAGGAGLASATKHITFSVKVNGTNPASGFNPRDVVIEGGNPYNVKVKEARALEQRVVLDLIPDNEIEQYLTNGMKADLDNDAVTVAAFRDKWAKYFQETFKVTLRSVTSQEYGTKWSIPTENMSLTSNVFLLGDADYDLITKTAASGATLNAINISHPHKTYDSFLQEWQGLDYYTLNMGGVGTAGSNDLKADVSYAGGPSSEYDVKQVNTGISTMFSLFTQSAIFADIGEDGKYLYPADDSKFKKDPVLEAMTSWDGFLPYKAEIKGVNKIMEAYGKQATSVMISGQSCPTYSSLHPCSNLMTVTTLDAAKAFAEGYNSGKVTNKDKIFVVDSCPGLFYNVVNNRGNYGTDPKEVEQLVKNVTASYDAGSGTFTINYELRSTNNSVNFFYMPVELNGKTVTSPFMPDVIQNFPSLQHIYGEWQHAPGMAGGYDKQNVQHDVSYSISVMEFPKDLGQTLGENGGVFYGCYFRGTPDDSKEYRGPGDISVDDKPDRQWYANLPVDTYHATDNTGGKYNASIRAPQGIDGDLQMGYNVKAPYDNGGEGAEHMLYYAVSDSKFATVHKQGDASTPKITWTGLAMWAENGSPYVSMSLSSTEWGDGKPIPTDPTVITIEKNVLQGTTPAWYEGADGLSYFEIAYQTDKRPTAIKLNGTEIPAGAAKWAPDSGSSGAVFDGEAATDPRPIEGNICADGKFVIALMPGDKITLEFVSDEEIVCSIKEIVRGGHDRAVSVNATNMFESDLSTAYPGQLIKDPTGDPTTEAYFKAGNVLKGASITYTNSRGAIDGPAHVIIDYNLNGKVATVADTTAQITSSQMVDCGAHEVGETINVKPVFYVGGSPEDLVAGQTYDVPIGNGTLHCTYKGLWTEAEGGTEITDGKFTIPRPGLSVLYAHWELSVDSIPIPIPGSSSASVHQVIFHDNYDGGGMTTVLWGKITLDLCCTGPAVIDFGEPDATVNSRPGWYLYGWCGGPTPGTPTDSMLTIYKYEQPGYGWAEHSVELRDAIRAWFERNEWPDRFNVYAIWTPHPTYFDANGGYFESGEDVYYNVSVAKDGEGRTTKYGGFVKSDGKTPYHGFFPSSVYKLPQIDQVPVREGYEFTGWYCDKDCSVPMTEDANGIMPNKTYYAGWRAQKVTVSYFDTREGMGHIGTQEYNYDDLLKLLSEPDAGNSPSQPDTSGQHFVHWGDKDGGSVTTTGTALNVETLGDRLVKHVSTVMDANGVVSDLVYWTLDLYTQWSEKTATYFANVVFNDLENNDGCRPTEVVLGIVSSVTNKEAGEIVIPVSADGTSASGELGGLPITNVDASVEKVTYRMYLKRYTDINHDVHIIQDTTAQSGSFEVPTTSWGSTTPLASYSYALDNVNHGDTYAAYNGTLYLNHSLITTESDIRFTISWADSSNQDGERPSAVKLVLLANGSPNLDDIAQNKEYVSVVSVNEGMCEVSADGNAWTYTFKDFQKYTNTTKPGTAIDYTVVVLNDDVDYLNFSTPYTMNGYTAHYLTGSQSTGDHAGVVLHRPLNRVDKTVNIHWSDELNRDGYRAESVTVNLYAYGFNRQTESWEKWFVDSVEMTGGMTADTWAHTFRDLYERNGGKDIVYMAEVSSDLNAHVPEGINQYGWTASELDITISQEHTVGDVVARVRWDDTGNNDNLRPSSVMLELYADGKPLTDYGWSEEDWRVVLSGDMTADEWTYVYHNIPEYAPGDTGKKLVYSLKVVEAKPGDLYGEYEERGVLGEGHTFTRYTASYPKSGTAEFTETFEDSTQPVVRLTHEINQIEVPVKITWMDSNNRDAMRPSYVTLALTAYQWNDETYKWEYVETATQTVKADGANTMTADEWTASFGLHDMYHDGVKIIYHLAVVSDLNEFIPEGSFEYGWVETAHGNQVDAVPEVTVSQNVNITSVTSTVFWDDSNNQDNIRPKNIILQLYAHAPGQTPEAVSGEAYRVNLSGDPTADNWTYTFSGMPKYAAGQSGIELIYTVRAIEAEGEPLYGYYIITANGGEEEVLRYEASYLHEDREAGTTENTLDADLSDRAYVKLSHVCETKTMNFSVNWHDDDDRDAMRMSSVSVDLYKTVGSGEPKYLRTLVITAGDNGTWTYKVTGLPGYEGGQPVKYTIEIPEDVRAQLAAGGYTATTEDNIVHLYHTPETGEIRTRLYWSDEDDNDGYRTDSVVAALYANGTPTGRTADLNEENNWSAAWTGLNAHYNQGAEHGLDVVYSVVIEAPEGYAVAYNPVDTTIERNETLYIQVSHAKDTAEVPVKVFWNDAGDTDRKRPENITVQLIVDGKPTDNTLTLSGSGDVWTGKFENMPVYGGDGERIYYSLKVYDGTASTGGYSVMTAGTTLYLSYKPVRSAMYVSFQFSDGNNTDGRRPTGLYLQLMANGEAVDDSEYKHTVSFDTNVDGYLWNFGDLPVYSKTGEKIAYNVAVTFADELGGSDYGVWTSSDVKLSESGDAAKNQVIVKLTRAVDETELTGHVYWFDCNDVEGNRPDALNIVVTDAYSGANVNYRLDAGKGTVTKAQGGEVVGSVDGPE